MPVQNVTEVPVDELHREVTAIVSGWDGGFHTRSNSEHKDKRVIPITSQEILSQLREIKVLCNKANLDRLARLISVHINNYNNPHRIDLSQFATDILQLLYHEYQNRGGIATYDAFLNILFEDYQIAGLDDIYDGTNPKLLTTVKNVAKYITNHNEDANAHTNLFQKMFPGDPIRTEPSVAIMAMYEISSAFQKNRGDRYSYIGKDGYRHLSNLTFLPIDYMFGRPTVANFKDRENKIAWSRDFTKTDTWGCVNLTPSFDQTGPYVNKDFPNMVAGSTALTESVDTDYVEHILFLKTQRLLANTNHSFSLDFKPVAARYACLRIVDKIFGIAKIAYINFDLETCFISTTDNSIHIRMIKLAEDFFHIEYSIYNERDADVDIQFIPYKTSSETQKYKGSGAILGYVDNAMLEEAIGASPFIYTAGEPVMRHGVKLEIPMDGWFDYDSGAFVFDIISPILINSGNKNRTLYTFRNGDSVGMCGTYGDNNLFYTKIYNENGVEVYNYPILATPKISRQLATGFNDTTITMATTGVSEKTTSLITARKKDMTVLDIGHNNGEDFLEGYFGAFTFYKKSWKPENITFLAGE